MTGMANDRDFRKLAPATQAELRRVAVAMVRAGKTRIEAAATVGVNRRFVGRWVKAAAQSGEAALVGGRRGRRPGEQKALSAAQQEGLRYLIARGCPDRYGLSFALWTRQAVRALIARESGVWLSLSVVGDYLRGWGFTAQRPMRRATALRQAQATGGGGPGMAGEHLSGDCPQSQGARLRNPLGRRDRPVQSGQLRPQLCSQGAHPGHPATGQALFAVNDFQSDQPRQAAFHDL
jgi:transposase